MSGAKVFGLDQPLEERIKKNKTQKKETPNGNKKPFRKGKTVSGFKGKRPGDKKVTKGGEKHLPSPKDIRISIVNSEKSKLGNAKSGFKPQMRAKHTSLLSRALKSSSAKFDSDKGKKISAGAKELHTSKKTKLSANIETKVKVWNIRVDIDDDAFQDVFNQMDGYRSSKIDMTPDKKSLGTGEIVFKNKNSAAAFVKEYDGVELDGQPLKLVLC